MNTTRVSWTLAAFFGSAIAFGAVRKLLEGKGAVVVLLAQLVVLGLIIGGIVLVVRHLDSDNDEDGDGDQDR